MTIKKAQKKTKTIKTLTVRELKTWLDGYCSAHGDEWSPSPDQWNLIKDKLFSLEDGTEERHIQPMPQQYARNVQNIQYAEQSQQPDVHYDTAPHAHMQPSNSNTNTVVSTAQFGGRPPQFNAHNGPANGPSGGYVGATSAPAMIHKDGKIITPNKDTAGGPSDFA